MTGRPGLIETMRVDGGAVALLDRHMARLSASADALGIPLDTDAVASDLLRAASNLLVPSKLRLELASDGTADITSETLAPLPDHPVAVIADATVSSDDPLLRHKTTRRAVYTAARAGLDAVDDGFDALLLNERGEVSEGAITNVFAVLDGVWVTPPPECGLLPGVMRAEVMRVRNAVERVLMPGDLTRAERIILTNAVRGEVAVTLVSP